MLVNIVLAAAALVLPSLACEACDDSSAQYGDVTMTRNVRRMQPDAQASHSKPRGPLEWGELNFLHTTDTHGWLEGHLKEQNYGADWGDFASFTKGMRQKAKSYGVDLLIVDTGDLHDGNGLSDITSPNGNISNPIFENIDYDLLTIGNHELYVSAIAYETFSQFSKAYGDRYLTTNVEILNPSTGEFEYIGERYREFTTPMGIKILAFGILYDFAGNSNVSRITFAANLVQDPWFIDAVKTTDADMFVLLGHNPPRANRGGSFQTIYNAIRAIRPHKPIQIFGGHTHVRDFVVYDVKATGLESGRYCETLGWLSINGLRDGAIKNNIPANVPQASRTAVAVSSPTASTTALAKRKASKPLYSRRYIDWNRLSFAYHAKGSQSSTFNTTKGLQISNEIFDDRKKLHLRKLYGCAPQTWCESCKPFGDPGNIFTVLTKALASQVVNTSRSDTARYIILNTGSVRFDLLQGPFTVDDKYIVSPFTDTFQFIPNVPYDTAKQVIGIINAGPVSKRSAPSYSALSLRSPEPQLTDSCLDPATALFKRSTDGLGHVFRRQNTSTLTPGYTTSDDFGTDGDDTVHSEIPYYTQPEYFQAAGGFPATGTPQTVDVVFLDFIAGDAVAALNQAGGNYTSADVQNYLPPTYTAQDYLPGYAKVAKAWQKHVPNCPIGDGFSA